MNSTMATAKIFEIITVIVVATIFHVQAIKFAISHSGDVSGQIESFKDGTQWSSKAPEPCEGNNLHCTGGLTNLVHWLYENKGTGFDFTTVRSENIFRVSSGNLIGGESGWISSMEEGWVKYGEIVKDHIRPSVMALGMKDFGAGLRQTNTYINAIKPSHVVLANTCEGQYADTPEKTFCDMTKGTINIDVIIDDAGTSHTIGFIGFVTPTVERLSLPGKLKFSAIVNKIKQITQQQPNIKTFIALGDGNLAIAKQIIDDVPKVKLVIYGAGFANTTDMRNSYPLKYNKGLIATAGRYGSAVGKLVLDVETSSGDIRLIEGKLVETVVPSKYNEEAEKVIPKVKEWRDKVNELKTGATSVLGTTRSEMEGGEVCWRNECNLGNLMTDAVVNCVLRKFWKPFPNPLHAVWHGGAFFEDKIPAKSNITKFDVHKWLPYHNNVHLVEIKGRDLREVFLKSASGIDPSKPGVKDWRQFLQVSNGLEVYYDTTSSVSQVTKIKIVHDDGGVPRLSDMQDDKDYYLAIPTYLYEGRGVYEFDRIIWKDVSFDNKPSSNMGFDDDCLRDYILALKQISVGLEERIWINSDDGGSGNSNGKCKGRSTAVTVILTLVYFVLILAIIYVGYFYVLPRLRRTSALEQYPPNQL